MGKTHGCRHFVVMHWLHALELQAKNEELRSELSRLAWQMLHVSVDGFVQDIPRKLAQADLALLRLSPQTMTESLVAQTPIIAFDWHFHERQNVEVLRAFGAGDGALCTDRQLHLIKGFCQDAMQREEWQRAAVRVSEKRIGKVFIESVFDRLAHPKSPSLVSSHHQPAALCVDDLSES